MFQVYKLPNLFRKKNISKYLRFINSPTIFEKWNILQMFRFINSPTFSERKIFSKYFRFINSSFFLEKKYSPNVSGLQIINSPIFFRKKKVYKYFRFINSPTGQCSVVLFRLTPTGIRIWRHVTLAFWTYGGFCKWGYPSSWMVYFMENPTKIAQSLWFGDSPNLLETWSIWYDITSTWYDIIYIYILVLTYPEVIKLIMIGVQSSSHHLSIRWLAIPDSQGFGLSPIHEVKVKKITLNGQIKMI